MSGTPLAAVYLVAAICFIFALKGLSNPRWARRGNLVGAAGMTLAVAATLSEPHLHHLAYILVAVAVGAAIGVPAARAVKMTAVPQMVAAFNGVGGGAAALVSLTEYLHSGATDSAGVAAAVVFSCIVGCVSFAGSVITFAKLQELMTTRAVRFPGAPVVGALTAAVAVGAGVATVPTRDVPLLLLAIAAALVFGVLLVLPVGGADVPIVISLLNAFTGLTVAASGYVLHNTLLIVAGTLVGASGTLLTRLMATAMGRPLTNTLFGALRRRPGGGAATGAGGADGPAGVRSIGVEDVAVLLGYARKVIFVPGYGLAVAQAQHTLRELAELLESRGVEVSYAIHPVAGRMPGHMNVLLAEANVPYESLAEMDQVNPEFARTDVALVVGANDVVNPAARTTPGSPIYGMPILDAESAKAVIFLKRSMRPGFAGIDNALFADPKTSLLFGDARESLSAVVTAVKAL